MMKKIISFFLFLFLSIYGFLLANSIDVYKLIDVYKREEIKITPEPEFGTNTNWALLFRDIDQSFAFLPDGSFFRSASKDNKIYKFDEKGDILFEFGQEGQGPGDFISPRELSILDGKYLVVGEHALNRRISIFDLKGNFIKLIKTSYAVNSCTSLEDSRIAIVSENTRSENDLSIKNSDIFIRDISTGKETKVASFQQTFKKSSLYAYNYYERAYISSINNGELLVAYSGNQEIFIYSLEGKKLSSFRINLTRKKIENKNIEYYLYEVVEGQPNEIARKKFHQFIKMSRDKIFFPEYFPYYRKFAVDPEDNILIFLNNLAENTKEVAFQVYKKNGQYICTTKVNSGNFRPVYPTFFHKNFFYNTLKLKESDDSSFLAKIRLE